MPDQTNHLLQSNNWLCGKGKTANIFYLDFGKAFGTAFYITCIVTLSLQRVDGWTTPQEESSLDHWVQRTGAEATSCKQHFAKVKAGADTAQHPHHWPGWRLQRTSSNTGGSISWGEEVGMLQSRAAIHRDLKLCKLEQWTSPGRSAHWVCSAWTAEH